MDDQRHAAYTDQPDTGDCAEGVDLAKHIVEEDHRLPPAGHEHQAALELEAPSREVPAVGDGCLVAVHQGAVQPLLREQSLQPSDPPLLLLDRQHHGEHLVDSRMTSSTGMMISTGTIFLPRPFSMTFRTAVRAMYW